MKKILLSSLLIAGMAPIMSAQDFPEAKIVSPVMGISAFSTVCVTWNFVDVTEGPSENRMVAITTPSGDRYTARAFTEFILEEDKGGSMDQSGTGAENALTVSYYSTLVMKGSETGSFTEQGIYTIVIPEGAVSIDGVPNPETTLTYNLGFIAEMEPATFELIHTETESALNITWDHQVLSVTRGAAAAISAMLIRESDGGEAELYNTPFSLIDDSTVLRVDLTGKVSKQGSYTLELPGGQLQNEEGEQNPTQTFTFVVDDSGVEVLEVDGQYKVFDLNGVKVLETRDSEVVKSLPSGIYIVNGKKVVL